MGIRELTEGFSLEQLKPSAKDLVGIILIPALIGVLLSNPKNHPVTIEGIGVEYSQGVGRHVVRTSEGLYYPEGLTDERFHELYETLIGQEAEAQWTLYRGFRSLLSFDYEKIAEIKLPDSSP